METDFIARKASVGHHSVLCVCVCTVCVRALLLTHTGSANLVDGAVSTNVLEMSRVPFPSAAQRLGLGASITSPQPQTGGGTNIHMHYLYVRDKKKTASRVSAEIDLYGNLQQRMQTSYLGDALMNMTARD